MIDPDRPRKILDKEIAAEIGVCPKTLNRWKREGLSLPRWPRTMRDSVGAVAAWMNPDESRPCEA